ncbi:MAG: ABC transporter substrate-binding protein [Thaumarchaeota archaeon]|nr:ABC transporter substrate-binding protein [Nitrososphaerota archaeon]
MKRELSQGLAMSRVIVVVIVLIIIIVAGVGVLFSLPKNTSTTSSSPSTSTTSSSPSTSTTSSSPSTSTTSSTSTQTFTWDTTQTIEQLDPGDSNGLFDFQIIQNVYEPLLYYNGSCSTCIIPWLAQNFSASSNLKTYNFSLRGGIRFADGEQLNSTAVFFSLNRLLIGDASSTTVHGIRAGRNIQQLLNYSLATAFCNCHEKYGVSYVNAVLTENFVQITGPLTFTLHVQHPNSAFEYLMALPETTILAPDYVMQHDLAIWNQSNSGYNLPYPTLTGNESSRINQYFMDLSSTCNAGATPNGCGARYLDGSYQGSLAGTGPYEIASVSQTTQDIVLKANPNYWGGPYQFLGGAKINPHFTTVNINYVPSLLTQELDLKAAASSGNAISVTIPSSNIYDVANKSALISSNSLVSIIPGVSLYGPYPTYSDIFDEFSTNVTNYYTGAYRTFQPFADRRFRLAFADAINVTQFNADINNNLGKVQTSVIPPGFPPSGSYNSSITPIYSYNPDESAKLLLDAMMHPITQFTFRNGTAAPTGLFNNTFGCPTLNAKNQCTNPIQRTITVDYPLGWYDTNSLIEISGVIDNISQTYNMGLTVTVVPEQFGQMFAQVDTGSVYMFSAGLFANYPWVTVETESAYYAGGLWPKETNWNLTSLNNLYLDSVNASASGDIPRLLSDTNQMNIIANQDVMYLWLYYLDSYVVMTSVVHGYYSNPAYQGFYLASLT